MQINASHHTSQKKQALKKILPFQENQELALAKQNCVVAFNYLEVKSEGKGK